MNGNSDTDRDSFRDTARPVLNRRRRGFVQDQVMTIFAMILGVVAQLAELQSIGQARRAIAVLIIASVILLLVSGMIRKVRTRDEARENVKLSLQAIYTNALNASGLNPNPPHKEAR